MPISREEEARRIKQLHRLNYFYAMTVVIMTLSVLFLLFNINTQQRELIDETAILIEQRAEEAERFDRRAEARLEQSLERFEDLEQILRSNGGDLERIEALEEKIEELINRLDEQ